MSKITFGICIKQGLFCTHKKEGNPAIVTTGWALRTPGYVTWRKADFKWGILKSQELREGEKEEVQVTQLRDAVKKFWGFHVPQGGCKESYFNVDLEVAKRVGLKLFPQTKKAIAWRDGDVNWPLCGDRFTIRGCSGWSHFTLQTYTVFVICISVKLEKSNFKSIIPSAGMEP